jgi:ketosteroid isomerase-like protein
LREKEELLMTLENEIRQVSEQFYAALNRVVNSDPGPMMDVWSHDSDVSTMTPRGHVNLGWEEVRAGWERAAHTLSEGHVSVEDLVVFPIADDVAYTLSTDHAQVKVGGEPVLIDGRVTSIYQREDGEWKIVHHHTDVSPAMVEALDRLEVGRGQG